MNHLPSLIGAVKRGDVECATAILESHDNLAKQRDESGATPLHYAALHGHRDVAKLLIEHGADINSPDGEFGATPAGWAVEYLREMGGHLAMELDDFAYAIKHGDTRWVSRFIERFPGLRRGCDTSGKTFKPHAQDSGSDEIAKFFELEDFV